METKKYQLTKSAANSLLSFFFKSDTKEYAIKRLKELCAKYNTNTYVLDYSFEDETIEQIDNSYLLILSF